MLLRTGSFDVVSKFSRLDNVIKTYMSNWLECDYCNYMYDTNKHFMNKDVCDNNICEECLSMIQKKEYETIAAETDMELRNLI